MNAIMVKSLARRYIKKMIEMEPMRGQINPNDLADMPWRAMTRMAGDDTPECYEARSVACSIIAKARQEAKDVNWQVLACEAVDRFEPKTTQHGKEKREVIAKITLHGIRWYFDGSAPSCPECDSENIDWSRDPDNTCALVWCKSCGCHWTQTREESAE